MSHNINDVLYGSIFLENIELQIIDHKLFQRLRRISQLGFLNYAFPSANHTRFEHSIGVMDLCSKMYERLLANQKNLILRNPGTESNLYERITEILENSKVKERLRLAALLHDVGHGPFSHTSEMYTSKISKEAILELDIPSFLKETFIKRFQSSDKKLKTPNHEWLTAIVSSYIFKGLKLQESLLQDVLSILNKDIDPSKDSVLSEGNIKQLLRELISGEIDGDRMDYLSRDSYYTGAKYGIFDLNRILSSLYFSIDENSVPHLALGEGGLLAFEDFLYSRYQMYIQIYLHRTAMGLECILEKFANDLEKMNYPLKEDEWTGFYDATFREWLKKELEQKGMTEHLENLLECVFERNPLKLIYDATLQNSDKEDFLDQKKKIEKEFKEDFDSFYFYEKTQSLSKLNRSEASSEKIDLKFLKHNEAGYPFEDFQKKPYFEKSFEKSLKIQRIFVEKKLYEDKKDQFEKLKNTP